MRIVLAFAVVAAAVVSPVGAASDTAGVLQQIPLHLTSDCSTSLATPLPERPGLPTPCAVPRTSTAGRVVPDPEAPGPCVAVVPLVDDRCEAWTARFDGPAGGPDYPTSDLGGSRLLAVSHDNTQVFAAATSDTNPSAAAGWAGIDFDLVVVAAAAADGATRWTTRLPEPGQAFAQNIVADPDGDLVYATSLNYGDTSECPRGATTMAIEQTTGTQRWTKQDAASDQGCLAVWSTALDPAGERLFVIGTEQGADGRAQQRLIARDADTGALLWTVATSGPGAVGGTGTALAVSPDGTRVHAGGSVLSDATGFVTHVAWTLRSYDTATGDIAAEAIWDVPHPQAQSPANPPAALVVTPDGAVVYGVGGVEHVTGRSLDITAVAFDTRSGQPRWVSRYDGPRDKSSFDSVWFNGPLALSHDGTKLAIAGYSTHLVGANLQLDLATLLLDAAGGQTRWATRYTSESETNWVPSVAIAPDAATVYVAAPSRYAALWEAPARYTTLAYDAASGAVAWTARHSDGHSFAQGSALAPDGQRFFVTGMTATAGPQTLTGADWGLGLAAYATK